MSHIRLLSTDFDGTLTEHFVGGRCTPALAEVLSTHKRLGGYWAVNTGRSLEHAIKGINEFAAPVLPDFLLTNEREIFHRNSAGEWVPETPWNDACYKRHDDLFVEAEPLIGRIRAMVDDHPGITWIEENGQPAGVVTSDERVMEEFVAFLERESPAHPELSHQRNTIYLRFAHRDYHKGSSLAELCRLLGVGHHEVLAAGDHFNDIPMLDGRFAKFPCCPVNAIPEVRETVQLAGGHCASKRAADGVAESWHVFHLSSNQ
jgi:hydroxymethylpyrimidine pyrophosphatase-like HAD family hydrolase